MKPDEELRLAANLFGIKNEEYGDNYKRHGEILANLFPNGIALVTAKDFNRFNLINNKVTKLTRYCHNFKTGHDDSLADDIIYTAMLKELDH